MARRGPTAATIARVEMLESEAAAPGRYGNVPAKRVAAAGIAPPVLTGIVDLSAALDGIWLERVVEAITRTPRGAPRGTPGLTSIDSIAARADVSFMPVAARSSLTAVLALRAGGVPATDGLLETRLVQLARAAGAPVPVRQLEVRPQGRRYFLDLSWPELRVFVELDGQGHEDQPVYDARRQTLVAAHTGWLCGRFTWAQVVNQPKATTRTLLGLLERGRLLSVTAG